MARYRVAHLGLGGRGTTHADAFLKLDDRFELVGLCELNHERLREYKEQKRLRQVPDFADAETMLRETKPDIFCFITHPNVPRVDFVRMAAGHDVRAVAMEKPMATSLAEARGILHACREHGIKGVVSHQQKYLTSLRHIKAKIDGGEIGRLVRIVASCQAWLAQLGTHYVDYVLWLNRESAPAWVVGHVHGRELLADHHPSPNYTMGQIGFDNGVRAVVEFGKLSAAHMPPEKFWVDNRLTAYGTHGCAWGETDGRTGFLGTSSGGVPVEAQGEDWATQSTRDLQPAYLAELADWLDGAVATHSCGLEVSYRGYEVMEALCISALENVRVDLPLDPARCEDIFERMRRTLPECPEREPAVTA